MLGASEVRRLLDESGLAARRSLGQNFVVDPGTVRRIARVAGVGPDRPALEIGPGLGSLTLALAETGAGVLAVEKDQQLVPVLRRVITDAGAAGLVRVLCADALGVDWGAILSEAPGGPAESAGLPAARSAWTMVANLPYNVAVPIVLDVLERAPTVERLVVMVQREVADRLVAAPGGRTIGVPSVKVAWYGTARIEMTVAPEVFEPRPRVDSAVVSIDRRPPPSGDVTPGEVFTLVERAYNQRRKMLRSTLGGVVPPEVFATAGVPPTARPEELDVTDWTRLASEARSNERRPSAEGDLNARTSPGGLHDLPRRGS